MKLASLAQRWGAAAVELLVIYAIHLLALAIVTGVLAWSPVSRPVTTAVLVAAAAFVMVLLYGCTEIFGDGAPAKRLFGLRVRSTSGLRLPPRLLARRWLVKALPVTAFMGIGFAIAFGAATGHVVKLVALTLLAGAFGLFAALDVFLAQRHSRQAFHDRIVGAVVVRAGRRVGAAGKRADQAVGNGS